MRDLRCKLTEEDRIKIRKLWKDGFNNYSLLAIQFGVHPKTIKKVVDEKYRLACNEFNRQNWYRYKPSKEHHAKLVREYRRRKKEYEER